MEEKITRENRKIQCPEEDRTADLTIEWQEIDGRRMIRSVCCDNPKLRDLDNWDCRWTCWEAMKDLDDGGD